jgi:protein-S-isoprenylcysteine O-methyltransferase Ste14
MVLLLKNLLFTLVVPGTVAVLVPFTVLRDGEPSSGALAVVACLFYLTGAAIYSWCVWDFASFGRGTPAPIDAPKKLVARGLYRYSRNPMYVGVLCVILGWITLFQSLGIALYGACVASAFQSFVCFYEEPKLAELFGEDYRVYRSRVGRWLPRFGSMLAGE